MDETFTFNIQDLERLGRFNKENFSLILAPGIGDPVVSTSESAEYEQFLADVWVGIVLTLMVLSCVCCMCSCLLYHKFQQWKRGVMDRRPDQNIEEGNPEAELPSYTIASGLPTYEEAIEQMKKVKELETVKPANIGHGWVPQTPPTPVTLSAENLFEIQKNPDPS